MITGLSHITLSVRDLALSFEFYSGALGLQPRLRWPQGAYLSAGGLWLALTVDDTTRRGPLPEYTHLAFEVPDERFAAMAAKLRRLGVVEWQPNTSEGDSLYFLDPDGHKLEVHASTLEKRLAHARAQSRADDEFFDRVKR